MPPGKAWWAGRMSTAARVTATTRSVRIAIRDTLIVSATVWITIKRATVCQWISPCLPTSWRWPKRRRDLGVAAAATRPRREQSWICGFDREFSEELSRPRLVGHDLAAGVQAARDDHTSSVSSWPKR